MQTFKFFSAICVMLLLGGVASVRAETEAQAKAREALRQKMMELDAGKSAQPAAPPAKKAPVVAPASPPPPRQPVAVQQPAPQRAPAVVPAAGEPETEAQAKARQALEQKMRELDAQKGAVPAPAPVVRQTPATTVPAAQAPTAPPVEDFSANEPDSEAVVKARAALHQKMRELQAQEVASGKLHVVRQTPAVSASAFVPLEAPKLPISSSKEAQLAELLRKYRADEVSPEEYHKQRAAILAQ